MPFARRRPKRPGRTRIAISAKAIYAVAVSDEPESAPPPENSGKARVRPLRERPGGPTQDELLDEALEETFPASDPTSVYRLD